MFLKFTREENIEILAENAWCMWIVTRKKQRNNNDPKPVDVFKIFPPNPSF